MTQSGNELSNARQALVASVVLTLLLYVVPYGHVIGRPLLWLSTLAHELGHGFTALLIGENFGKFVMFPNGSGAATWSGNPGAIGRALIAAGGLVGPAIVAAGCFLAARTERGARLTLGAGSVLMGIVVLVWARSWFAIVFAGAVGLVLGFVARKGSEEVARVVLMFTGVQLALSVFSRSDYLFVEKARTSAGTMPSDVAQIAEALWLPYWFWGGLLAVVSVAVLVGGLWLSVGPNAEESKIG
jgi:hypothetical protein